jgi:glycolate dehydrogenase FAD-binding subunit
LHPMPKESRTVSCLARDVRDAQRLVLAIQDSKLAHSALQMRFVDAMQPQIDVLFEATEAGCAAQVARLKQLLSSARLIESVPACWNARQVLYSETTENSAASAVTKVSVLPTQTAETCEALAATGGANRVHFEAVIYATGIGTICLAGSPNDISTTLKNLRGKVETLGGSLTIANRPDTMPQLDAWGNAGDALPLMCAVKQQFDPKATLNPGRFVGGI